MTAQTITPLSTAETAAFCSQMAMILRSGISSIEGIALLMDDASSTEKALLGAIQSKLSETGSLAQAIAYTEAFPNYMIHMVTLGEQAGRLDEVMSSLSDYYEKECALHQTIRNAVAYPLLMIAMMFAVIVVLITKIMPIFQQVFRQLGAEMNASSLIILQFGEYLRSHIGIVIGISFLFVLSFICLCKTAKGQRLLRCIPVVRCLKEAIAAKRFASGMALTLSSGLTSQESMELACKLVDDPILSQRLSCCQQAVMDGADMCDALREYNIFSGLYAKMASLGSRTGMLDEVMKKIADQYEEEIDTRLSSLLAAIEPTLVIILSLIVGMILLSVMIPMVSIMSGL